VSLAADVAESRGYDIMSEEFGLSPDGSKMFGVFKFALNGDLSRTRCLGIRNSHDKSLCLGLVAGFSVMVCDNLCFGGESNLKRKHTSRMNYRDLIPEAFDAIDAQYSVLDDKIEDLKLAPLTDQAAKAAVIDASAAGVVASCDIMPVWRTYLEPPHEEFRPRNRWSLHNAFTEVGKKYSNVKAESFNRKLAREFALS
jgi:hypothetical protein